MPETTKTLTVDITAKADRTFTVTVSEPESGETATFEPYAYDKDGCPKFDRDIVSEVYAWVSLMMDAVEEGEE